MGKAKKNNKSVKRQANIPLGEQILSSTYARPTIREKDRVRQEEEQEVVDAKLSEKILLQARKQQEELEDDGTISRGKSHISSLGNEELSDDEDAQPFQDNDQFDYYDDIKVNDEDERALQRFMNRDPAPRLTLADIIREKITEKQTELVTQFSDNQSLILEDLDPRVKSMYQGVRDVLAKYRSGKVPKAFKIVPKLKNWEQILFITDPGKWSAAAMYMATRIFASNLKDKMAQRFFNLVLLPRIRDDICDYKRLNFHLYQAMRKALFKPAAFMKGFLLPLCESGTCTLREAIIIGSVIARNSIPMLHSAAAILKLAEMDYNGANSIFLRILFDKKYALPFRVVDAVVFHFLRFERDRRELPVLWHQSLLTFVQRYKSDISSEQKEALLRLLRFQTHHSLTPEIRRELQSAKCRDLETEEPADIFQ